ncbi:hypothetical protein WJX74_006142 [Apatococcus lobatus]|uniref:Uncharacterized protein n=1 Tax=Apatococcus lobatus TaxID=904363 RepID=A0AAW1RTM0_9CHLO
MAQASINPGRVAGGSSAQAGKNRDGSSARQKRGARKVASASTAAEPTRPTSVPQQQRKHARPSKNHAAEYWSLQQRMRPVLLPTLLQIQEQAETKETAVSEDFLGHLALSRQEQEDNGKVASYADVINLQFLWHMHGRKLRDRVNEYNQAQQQPHMFPAAASPIEPQTGPQVPELADSKPEVVAANAAACDGSQEMGVTSRAQPGWMKRAVGQTGDGTAAAEPVVPPAQCTSLPAMPFDTLPSASSPQDVDGGQVRASPKKLCVALSNRFEESAKAAPKQNTPPEDQPSRCVEQDIWPPGWLDNMGNLGAGLQSPTFKPAGDPVNAAMVDTDGPSVHQTRTGLKKMKKAELVEHASGLQLRITQLEKQLKASQAAPQGLTKERFFPPANAAPARVKVRLQSKLPDAVAVKTKQAGADGHEDLQAAQDEELWCQAIPDGGPCNACVICYVSQTTPGDSGNIPVNHLLSLSGRAGHSYE